VRDGHPLLRFGLGGLIGIALAVIGAVIGATLWPRVVRVREQVVSTTRAAAPAAGGAGLDALPDLVQQACPAIVAVGEPGTDARAAGFFISPDGYLVTSARAVTDNSSVQIVTNDGNAHDASIIGTDPLTGVAVLKVDESGLAALDFADPNFPRVGQWGVALADPNGSGCVLAAGLVSTDFLAEGGGPATYVGMRPPLDAMFAGAPVIGPGGQVIGLALAPPAASTGDGAEDLHILPVASVQRVASELMRTGRLTTNRFGLAAEDLTPVLATRLGVEGSRGTVVSAVKPNSPAGRAGVRAGDIILSVNDQPISSASEFGRGLDTEARQVTLAVQRRDRRLSLTVSAPGGR
jgi:S1-C subfamily serine protease